LFEGDALGRVGGRGGAGPCQGSQQQAGGAAECGAGGGGDTHENVRKLGWAAGKNGSGAGIVGNPDCERNRK
jgi:hypothetical protein